MPKVVCSKGAGDTKTSSRALRSAAETSRAGVCGTSLIVTIDSLFGEGSSFGTISGAF
jgi:hypothetical protein